MKKINIATFIALVTLLFGRMLKDVKGYFPIPIIYLCTVIVLGYPYLVAWYKKKTSIKIAGFIAISWTAVLIYSIAFVIPRLNYLENERKKENNGIYRDKIEEKYPEAFGKGDKYRKIIKDSIVKENEIKTDDYIYTEYFDKENRVVYKIKRTLQTIKSNKGSSKGTAMVVTQTFSPEEEGFIYDEKGRVIHKIKTVDTIPYTIKSDDKNTFYSYLNDGGISILTTDISYPTGKERIEVEEYGTMEKWAQLYVRNEKKFINDKLVNEIEILDEENKFGLIIATIEKKYNEKGELIYKTVERKDKTNDYKSFTEMDFAKDEIVTKYYKGKDVFATVTENLVGPVESIEETEMVKGQEVKKVYKNKVKAIVKRQKVGEPVKIVDVIEFYDKEKSKKYYNRSYSIIVNTRYIFDENGKLKYKVLGEKDVSNSYLYNKEDNFENSFEFYFLHDSFYSYLKKDEMTQFLRGIRKIEGFNDDKIYSYKIDYANDNNAYNKIILGTISEKDMMEKKFINENKNITLEELLNGYKYE